jgi:hypothetical protein
VVGAGGDRGDAREADRNGGLAVSVQAPSDDGPGLRGPGEVVAAVALAAGVGGARVGVVAAVVAGTVAVVAVAAIAVGTLAVVGVAPLLLEQAATIASRPPMRAALVILVRASGCPIISTPPVGTHAEPSEDEDHAASIALRWRRGAIARQVAHGLRNGPDFGQSRQRPGR